MIQANELSAGPLAGVASAALLLFAAVLVLRFRGDLAGAESRGRPEPDAAFRELVIDAPPAPLALTASAFLHLLLLALIPYAGILAPGIAIRPASSELVLLEYRGSHGDVLTSPWRPERKPFRGVRAEEESGAHASAHRRSREETAAVAPVVRLEPAEAAAVVDIEVARFDTVIQMSTPDAPLAPAVGEVWNAPDFVLDWRTSQTQPGAAVLAEIAALVEVDAVLERLNTLAKFSAREGFNPRTELTGVLSNPPLAEYGPAMVAPPATVSGGAGPPGAQPTDRDFTLPRLDGHVGRRRLAYLMLPLVLPEAGNGLAMHERVVQRDVESSGGEDVTPEGEQRNPARPLERRRYGIILVGPGARGQIPEADGRFTGNPVYTVYLTVPGSARKWVLQFCRPGGAARSIDVSNGVIRFRPRRALDPPYARRTEPVRLDPAVGGHGARAVVFGILDSAGSLSKLQMISGPSGESGERILASLRAWEFLPAFEDGKPVTVEAVFSIP